MAQEINGNRKPLRQDGYYVHKETGAEVYIENDVTIGTPIADAFVQAGWEYVGKEPTKKSEPDLKEEVKNVKK